MPSLKAWWEKDSFAVHEILGNPTWRCATAEDLSSILKAQRETFLLTWGRAPIPQETANMDRRAAEAIGSPHAHLLEILEVRGSAVGYYWVSLLALPDPVLLDLHVFSAKRGQGLGQILMRRILTSLADRGRHRMRLMVSSENAEALALYRRFEARTISTTGTLLTLSIHSGLAD